MKVNRLTYLHAINKLENNKAKKNETNSNDLKDTISISNESIKLNEYLKNNKADDLEKIQQIKNALKEGTYRIDSGKLAQKIIERIKEQKDGEQ